MSARGFVSDQSHYISVDTQPVRALAKYIPYLPEPKKFGYYPLRKYTSIPRKFSKNPRRVKQASKSDKINFFSAHSSEAY